jgi:hypothetical protein
MNTEGLKIIFASLILFSAIISCKKELKPKELIENEATSFAMKPPISNVLIKYNEFEINPLKDTIIKHKSGAVIEIPKNAFLNANGDVIIESVNLKFRSFSNSLEIYLAGIPMTAEINGEKMVYESAGMFEIKADKNGKKLYVNKESKIKVTLESFENDTNFNTYDLEEETGVWVETGKDEVQVKSKEEELSKIPKRPTPPKKAGRYAFQIEDMLYENSEISKYENVWFTPVDGQSCGFDSKDIKLRDLKNGTFEVTFIPWIKVEGTKTKCVCYLSFKDDSEYSIAIKDYQKKYAKQISRIEAAREAIEKEWDVYDVKLQEYKVFRARNDIKNLKGAQKILRTQQVNNFGFVNCDRPINIPKGGKIVVTYVDASGKEIELKNVVLIEKGRNALFRYTNEIKFNPNKENLLWGITKKGRLAYFSTENFQNLEATTGNVKLQMNVHPAVLNTYDEIINVLFPNK